MRRRSTPRMRGACCAAAASGAAVLALVGACGVAGGAGPGAARPPDGTAVSAVPTPSMANADLAAVLQRAVVEERHARATYQNVLDALGAVAPFRSIVGSEETHIAALETVAGAHGITLPADTEPGTASPSTIAAACAMGVAAENADGQLYDALLPKVAAYPDVQQVFTALRSASLNNHLPAFQRCT